MRAMPEAEQYLFSASWFSQHKTIWRRILNERKPKRLLEVGSYEGMSTVFLIQELSKSHSIELHCIDNWEGGIEHKNIKTNMQEIEERFINNMKLASKGCRHRPNIKIHKGTSSHEMPKLITAGLREYFDFIYIDGSHQAPDVLLDAVLAFELLKIGGIMIFDDYLWNEPRPGGKDPLRCPKIAIDAFTSIYGNKVKIMSEPLYQLYVTKTMS